MDAQKEKLADKVMELMLDLYLKRLNEFLAKNPEATDQEIWEFTAKMVNSVTSIKRKPGAAQEFAVWLYNGTIEMLRKTD